MEVKITRFRILRQICQLTNWRSYLSSIPAEKQNSNSSYAKINYRQVLGCIILLMMSGLGAFAQNSITGTVKNSENSQPIPGSSVFIKGTNIGTTSNDRGVFSLQFSGAPTLVVSAVGFATKEIKIGRGQKLVNITLVAKTEDLEEVVVTALGYKTAGKIFGLFYSNNN